MGEGKSPGYRVFQRGEGERAIVCCVFHTLPCDPAAHFPFLACPLMHKILL